MHQAVLILCDPTSKDNWKSFASWYSCRINLPDAQVVLGVRRPACGEPFEAFAWPFRMKVPVFHYASEPAARCQSMVGEAPLLVVRAGTLVVRPPGEPADTNEVVDARDAHTSWMVAIGEGVGTFVSSAWLDRDGAPFGRADSFGRGDLTVNERRVLSLWKRMSPVYDSIG